MAFIFFIFVVVCFSFVLLFGAPYLPTRKDQIDQALDSLQLKPGQSLLELGAGSGGLTIFAAKAGISVTAYELNPLLCVVLWVRARKYRKLVTIRMGNFWKTTFTGYDAVYVFLLDSYMRKLDSKMTNEATPGTLLASYTFQIPGKKVHRTNGPIFVYKY